MSLYSASDLDKPTFTPGRPQTLWQGETIDPAASPPTMQSSQQIAFHRDPHLPQCFAIEVKFSGDPGTFDIEIQTSDTDDDQYYVKKASITTGLNAYWVVRAEVLNVVAKYVRLHMKTLTNSVSVTAKIF